MEALQSPLSATSDEFYDAAEARVPVSSGASETGRPAALRRQPTQYYDTWEGEATDRATDRTKGRICGGDWLDSVSSLLSPQSITSDPIIDSLRRQSGA